MVLRSEIDARKRAVQLQGGGIICSSGIAGISKISQVMFLALVRNLRRPKSCRLEPRDTSEPGAIGLQEFLVGPILRWCGVTEVASSVIQPIAIGMISLESAARLKDGMMEKDVALPTFANGPRRIPSLRGVPFVAQNVFSISGVNQGNFALGEKNEGDTIGLHRALLTLAATPGTVSAVARHPYASTNYSGWEA